MTNKKFKKAMALMTATGMAVSSFAATSVFAETAATFAGDCDIVVTSTDSEARSYDLYQIFTGTYQMVDGNAVLSNIDWGDSVEAYSTEILTALKSATMPDGTTTNALASSFASAKDGRDVAAEVETFGDNSTKIDDFNTIVYSVLAKHSDAPKLTRSTYTSTEGNNEYDYTFGNVHAGYYLVKEGKNSNSTSKTITYSKFLVKVVGTSSSKVTKIVSKASGGPDIRKKIVDKNADGTEYLTDKADEAIGDTVKFQLNSNVPNMNGYSKYFFVVNDTLVKGMTLDDESFTVKVGDKTLTKVDIENDQGQTFHVDPVTTTDGTTKFKIVLNNFIQYSDLKDAEIVITYSAKTNDKLKIGNTEENTNVVNLTYSNDPNYDYSGVNEPGTTPNPSDPSNPTPDPVSTTPDSTVYVYSAGIELIKVDDDGNRLTGASFKIESANDKTSLNTVAVVTQTHTPVGYASDELEANGDGDTIYYKSITGSYLEGNPVIRDGKLLSEQTDQASSEIDTSEYEAPVLVTYTENADGSHTRDLNGSYYKLADKEEYVAINDAATEEETYETDYLAYEREEKIDFIEKGTGETVYEGTVGENGVLVLEGLSEGTYTITETAAPLGYNQLDDPITVNVSFNADAEDGIYWSYYDSTSGIYTAGSPAKPDDGIYEVQIENKKGSTLPSTGGIGTTIFYAAGSVLVISAGVLLVTKKRMKKSEK
jgi:fimbrial isopeptide formation D2 family protein/LPXTG-motif cell wall-anchored protein